MAWYLNRALTNLRAEVDGVWPNRDRTSDGTIGDEAHQGSSSDHNPDPDGSVDAWDMDEDGVDCWYIIDKFEQHEAAGYWIYERLIAKRSNGWRRDNYTGSNPHDRHVHFNTREGYEDSDEPWEIGEDEMTRDEFIGHFRAAVRDPQVAGDLKSFPSQGAWPVGYPEEPAAGGKESAGYRWNVAAVEAAAAAASSKAVLDMLATEPEIVAAAIVAEMTETDALRVAQLITSKFEPDDT